MAARDTFYCASCGTGCPVTCLPTHRNKYACHNISCSARGPALQSSPQEQLHSSPNAVITYHKSTSNDSLIVHTGRTFLGAAQEPKDPSVTRCLDADKYLPSYLLSKDATTRPIEQHRQNTSDKHSRSYKLHTSESPQTEPSISEIEPGLFVGNIYCLSERLLREKGITAVISVFSAPIADSADSRMREIIPLKERLFLKAHDTKWQDLVQYFPGACVFIDRRLRPYLYQNEDETKTRKSEQEKPTLPCQIENAKKEQKIIIHCRKGISRSGTIAAAYLMYKKRKPYDEVIASMRRSRPKVNPNPSFQSQLELWFETGFQLYSDKTLTIRCKEYDDFRLRLRLERLKQ